MVTAQEEAREQFERAAARAGVSVRPMTDTSELAATEALLAAVWEHPPGSVELDITLLAALARSGNYVVGAFQGERLVGATAGFRGDPFPVTLYSHVTGVDRHSAAPGTGTALKSYQRLWCLERGITGVRWTFDALQSRNAKLNLGRLGAGWVSFHADYYGDLRDGLNRDTGSDRLLLHWDLTRTSAERTPAPEETQTLLSRGAGGAPVLDAVPQILRPAQSGELTQEAKPTRACRVEIPTDIDELRVRDPHLARRWRDTLREVLPDLIAGGWRVIDFDESGAYVITPPAPEEAS